MTRLFADADSGSSTASEDSESEPSSVDMNDLIHQEHTAVSRDDSPLHNLSTCEEISEKESAPSSIDGKIYLLNICQVYARHYLFLFITVLL